MTLGCSCVAVQLLDNFYCICAPATQFPMHWNYMQKGVKFQNGWIFSFKYIKSDVFFIFFLEILSYNIFLYLFVSLYLFASLYLFVSLYHLVSLYIFVSLYLLSLCLSEQDMIYTIHIHIQRYKNIKTSKYIIRNKSASKTNTLIVSF